MATNKMAGMPVIVVLQFLFSFLFLFCLFYGGYYHVPEGTIPVPKDGDLLTKLFYTLRCFFVPISFFWVAINFVALQRLPTGAFNPLDGPEHLMDLSKKRLRNTMEQMTIYAVQSLILAVLLERNEMKVVFLYSLAFIVGRIFFWFGYGIHPLARALGFSLNYFSSSIVQGIAAYLVCSRYYLMFSHRTAIFTGIMVPLSLVFLPEFFFP